MSEKLHLAVEGRSYVVEVDDLTASPLTVRVNGKTFLVEVLADKTVASLSLSGPEPPGGTLPLGEGFAGSDVKEVTAPMPGNILDIAVKPADRVAHKQLLCHLEAMKMKNAIRAPCDGIIAAVHVREGQTVAYGDPLFTFE
jgi:biotin carboxyl carrier protein